MIPAVRSALACVLLVLAATVPALSPARSEEVKRFSPIPSHLPLGVEACFGRVYDAAHLRKHPKQRVTAFHLFRDFTVDGNAEDPPISSGTFKDGDGEGGSVGLSAYVSFRDRPGVFSNWLGCQPGRNGGVRCGVECDGGGFKLRGSGAALLVENEGFVVTGGCGASEDENEQRDFVKPGADDKVFRLDPKPVATCAAVRDTLKPKWASLGAPIRQRLERSEPLCFSRSYDAAHLARHPQQTVRRIAVFKAAGSKPVFEETSTYELTFRIERKDGQKFEKKTTCSAEKYAYACTHDPKMDTQQDFFLTRAGNDQVMLRDRRGRLNDMFGVRLGTDDRMFRLPTALASACEF